MTTPRTITPFFVACIAGIGMFLSTLDSAIINIAIPTLIKVFHQPIDTVIWTVTLYILAVSSTIMLFGQLADRYGRLKIYQIGLLFFGLMSFLCGLSPSIHWLIFFRTLQGLGAAMMQATAIAVITATLKKEDVTKAVSILSLLMGLGPSLGPVLGGLLISTIGWRWIFWINIPFCLYGWYGAEALKINKEILHSHPVGYLSLALFGFSMLLLLLGMHSIMSPLTAVYFLIATMIVFSIHFYIDQHAKYPMMHYRLWKKIAFGAPMISLLVMGGATAIVFILPPLFLQDIRHFEAWKVGLVSMSNALGFIVVSQFFPFFSRGCSVDKLMVLGIAIMALSLIALTPIAAQWPILYIFTLLFLYGLGAGFFVNANTLYLTAQFPEQQQAFITSIARMILNTGIAFGSAAAAMLVTLHTDNILPGIQATWWFAAWMALAALFALLILLARNRLHAKT